MEDLPLKMLLAKDGKTVLVAAGEIIDEDMAKKIDEAGVTEVVIRSPLTCEARYGMCAKCYGWDLGNKENG